MIRVLQIKLLPLGPLQTNCYLAACDQTKLASVVDPAWDAHAIQKAADDEGWQIASILLTHCHFDHVGGLAELKTGTEAPIYVHADAVPMLKKAAAAAGLFGLQMKTPPAPDQLINEGDTIQVGNVAFDVLYTPGHAPGHVCFYSAQYQVVFDGDVLFQQGIGRTDFEGGDFDTLIRSIREKLLTMPDGTRVFSGHGPMTTIGDERRTNPWL